MKKFIILLALLFAATSVAAEPVEAGFFDWVKGFFGGEKEQEQNTAKINDTINVTIANTSFSENQIISKINSNEQYRSYIKKLGYDCFQFFIGDSENFSARFNVENSSIKDLSKQYICEDEIKVEESLVQQIQEEGFNSSKIKQYRKQVDVPFGVYWALGKEYMS